MSAPILVIDDDAMVRSAITRILKAEGYEVALAEDGRRGVEMLKSLAPRLVITDIIMPEKEGIETIIEMRKLTSDLRIIAISGGGRMGNAQVLDIAGKIGANAVLAKPFDPEDLVALVRKQLAEV